MPRPRLNGPRSAALAKRRALRRGLALLWSGGSGPRGEVAEALRSVVHVEYRASEYLEGWGLTRGVWVRADVAEFVCALRILDLRPAEVRWALARYLSEPEWGRALIHTAALQSALAGVPERLLSADEARELIWPYWQREASGDVVHFPREHPHNVGKPFALAPWSTR